MPFLFSCAVLCCAATGAPASFHRTAWSSVPADRASARRCFVLGVEFLPPPARVPFSLLLLSFRRRVLAPSSQEPRASTRFLISCSTLRYRAQGFVSRMYARPDDSFARAVCLRFAAAQDLFFLGDFSCWTRFSAPLQLILVASLCAVGFCFRFGFHPPTSLSPPVFDPSSRLGQALPSFSFLLLLPICFTGDQNKCLQLAAVSGFALFVPGSAARLYSSDCVTKSALFSSHRKARVFLLSLCSYNYFSSTPTVCLIKYL
jgi:hypothetical protein